MNRTYDLIIGASESVAMSVKKIGFPAKNTRWVYSSLDTEHLDQWENIQIADSHSPKVILMFAWRFQRKGVDFAIDAIHDLIKEGHDIILALAYACDDEMMRSEVQDYIGVIPSWIKFLGSTPNVANLYNNADIFLSSSREEGYTYSVLEAAYCKPMIIVSNIGGHPQDIPGSKIFSLANREELKTAILHFLTQEDHQLQKIQKLQKDYVSRNYNIDDWAETVYKLYVDL